MNFAQYTEMAARTDKLIDNSEHWNLINAAMGMVGESAETLEHMKKAVFQGHKLDKDKLIEEAGDTLWYIAKMARLCGVTLEELAERNIEKLKKRYPKGFDPNMSINREGS